MRIIGGGARACMNPKAQNIGEALEPSDLTKSVPMSYVSCPVARRTRS